MQRIWEHRILKKKLNKIIERDFSYQEEILKKYNGPVVLDGYWQSEKYFKSIREDLIKDLQITTLSEEEDLKVIEEINRTNSVSLHVRRADYTNLDTQNIHGLCDIDYYGRAIEILADKVEKPHFFIFSDDIIWAEENLKINFPINFVGHNDADKNYEDLRMMSLCKHNIIANSSFSWWGAWLNTNPAKITIAPERWFATTERNFEDVIPDSWIKI
jgi:Glycosyl transferase family 11